LPAGRDVPDEQVNEAVDHLRSGKARYRVVLDASQ
jgi:alcohol/geraniol dehydrogenase (NADP+)